MAARADYATKKDLEETNDCVRANGIMLERLDSKVDAVIELLGTLASKSDLAEVDTRLSERISRLESAVRDNTDETRLLRDEVRLCAPLIP